MIRRALERQVHQLVGFGSGQIDLGTGDAGLFGPRSAAWVVHRDFTTMMVGGVAALLMQMLHPGALAGVWDHSNFRHDMLGRLKRTAQFISGTTYGSTEQAEALIARVRAIHGRVRGELPGDGAYSADDPDLLAWVHVAEVSSFLGAYLRYRNPGYPVIDQDRYLAETAVVAHRLGANSVPMTRAELSLYFRTTRSGLRADDRTRTVARALLSQPAPSPALMPFGKLILQAGVELLPEWAARMHGLRPGPRPAIRAGVHGVGAALRWALRDSSARRAGQRVGE